MIFLIPLLSYNNWGALFWVDIHKDSNQKNTFFSQIAPICMKLVPLEHCYGDSEKEFLNVKIIVEPNLLLSKFTFQCYRNIDTLDTNLTLQDM